MKNGGIDTQFYFGIGDSILFAELVIQFYFGIGDSILFRNW